MPLLQNMRLLQMHKRQEGDCMTKELTLQQLQADAILVHEKIKAAKAAQQANAHAAALYESSERDEKHFWGKLRRIEDKMEHLDRYKNDKELQALVAKFTQVAEDDFQAFKFFTHAEAKFAQTNRDGRRLHIEIVCAQVCDHDVKTVLANAEKVAGRKITDWFISASIGHNYKHEAAAWLTYHLTFDGGPV
jgi:hypothetical protein